LEFCLQEEGLRFRLRSLQVNAEAQSPDEGRFRQSTPAAEHVLAGNPGVHTELLGKVAEPAADFVLLAEAVDITQPHAARVRFPERRHDAHRSRLAGAVRTQQAIHAAGYGQ